MTEPLGQRSSTFREDTGRQWDIPVDAPLVARSAAAPVPTRRKRRRLFLAAAALVAGALSWAVWQVNGTLGTTEVGPWNMKMTSASKRPMLALVYGKEAGFHLVKVPGATTGSPTILPARLGQSLYVVSLGRSPLEVSAVAPANHQPMSWTARGRVIKAYRNEIGTGVRAW